MQIITSMQNETIKFLKSLKSKKGRQESGTYLLEGRRAVLDALKHGVEFVCVLITDSFNEPLEEAACGRLIHVPEHILQALAETSAPEGIIAQAKIQTRHFDESVKPDGLVLLLDHLQDAGNLGTMIRTADAVGAGAVVLSPECVELYNPKTIRATMSSIFNIPVYESASLPEAMNILKKKGYTVFAAALNGTDAYMETQTGLCALVIGNEGNGITKEALTVADRIITLPMRGKAESLNAAVAAGILMYHFTFGK